MTIYLVWRALPDADQNDYDDRLLVVCDTIEKARQYKDRMFGHHYITEETLNATIGGKTVE